MMSACLDEIMVNFIIYTAAVIDFYQMWCIPPPCPHASCRPVFMNHCLYVDLTLFSFPALSHLFPSFPLPCLFSLLFVPVFPVACFFFIKLPMMTVYNSRNHWHYSVYFDDIFVSRSMCVSERKKSRLLTVLYVFCAAGLVCMKSSTSVVELVMLLCSQVSGFSPHCAHTYDPFTLKTNPNPNMSCSLKFVFQTHSSLLNWLHRKLSSYWFALRGYSVSALQM